MEAVTPMFPLGTVLFPGMALPLHVFEPRYQALLRDCLAGPGRFGVVLIERGSEVGGGDERFSVGTLAEIRDVRPLEGGRFALLVTGERRVRVSRWLPDDPYPRAILAEFPEQPPSRPGTVPREALRAAAHALGRALALAGEAGLRTPRLAPLEELEARFVRDPAAVSFRLAALVPAGPLDRQRLLEAPSSSERLALVEHCCEEAVALFSLGHRGEGRGEGRPLG